MGAFYMPRKTHKNKVYSPELKLQAVQDYLAGKGSQWEICRKYGISARIRLQEWISCYNGHKEFRRRSDVKGEIYMTKGRKTTQEERVQMVAFCIEHGKDYALTVETYQVSYQQIYSWVRKYEANGVEGLVVFIFFRRRAFSGGFPDTIDSVTLSKLKTYFATSFIFSMVAES